MCVTRLTAYEIAGNPDDIIIDHAGPIEEAEYKGKYVGWITRGAGHDYKPLLSSNPIFDSAEEAEEAMRKIVQSINEFVKKEIEEKQDPLSKFAAPEDAELIKKIASATQKLKSKK